MTTNNTALDNKTGLEKTVQQAYEAWGVFKNVSGKKKSLLLKTIADEIEALGDTLIHKVMEESGLPEGRVKGERGRTCNQLRLFASLVEEGSWVEATIDGNIRKMLHAIGPVAVFGASNFPLAFSTAGGDTASALAAGCPVIVKAHPSHLGTNALVAKAVTQAVKKCNLPEGVFSSIQGEIALGQALVAHPLIKAVGFTGSFHAGTALMKIASERTEPIPVYAEMGSTNPIILLSEKLAANSEEIAKTLAGSVNLGAGQFCTNPGLILTQEDENTPSFLASLKDAFAQLVPATMLNQGIFQSYEANRDKLLQTDNVQGIYIHKQNGEERIGLPGVASVQAKDFLNNAHLKEEIFGPFTLVVLCNETYPIEKVLKHLPGQLTGTIMGTEKEISENTNLIEEVSQKVGRLIFNGVPTGVEVCPAMHHGGPFPAASNSLYTSVGTDAIKRFARPISYQNAPEAILPDALKQNNVLNIWRTVNGKKVR